MKETAKKFFNFGELDLKRVMLVLFVLGTAVILINQFTFARMASFTQIVTEHIAEQNGPETVRRTLYHKLPNIGNIFRFLMLVIVQVAFLRMGLEILYIILRGFKDLSHLQFLKDKEN